MRQQPQNDSGPSEVGAEPTPDERAADQLTSMPQPAADAKMAPMIGLSSK